MPLRACRNSDMAANLLDQTYGLIEAAPPVARPALAGALAADAL